MTHTTAGIEPVSVVGGQPAGTSRVRSVTMHSLAAALMYVSPLQLFVPTAFISSGLKNGRRGIWGAIVLTSLVVMGAVALRQSVPTNVNVALVLRLIFEIGIPSVVVSVLIRRAVPFGAVVLTGVGVAALGFMTTELLMRELIGSSHYGTIVENFRTVTGANIDAFRTLGLNKARLSEMSTFYRIIAASFMPFLLVGVSVMTFLMSVVMVPRLPVGRITGATYLFRNLTWPDWLLFGFIAGGLSPLVKGSARTILLNVLALVIFLYLLQGLAIFRSMVMRMGLSLFGITIAYFLLALMTLWGVAPFVLFVAGLFDPFFDFRNLKRKGENDESHTD